MLEIKGKSFYLNGKKFNIYSGAMHYFRMPHEYWEDRLIKLKAAGFNTVETYVAWNVHQPTETGDFCFEGQNDLVQYIKTAQNVGLFVIVRPGPYICAEWDFGGFPSWLLKYDDIKLRCFSQPYLSFVEKYFNVLLPKLAELQITRGGPIIMIQIENEYGSYGRDKKYLNYLRELMRKNAIDITLFTSDGETSYYLTGGSLEDEFKVVNFGGYPKDCFNDLRKYQPDKPLMCGEMWCGWFDHFREKHHHTPAPAVKEMYAKITNQFLEEDANFNYYMFHGGTNFGFMAGANYNSVYQPTVTSYDYDAPLNEYGDYTPKYYAIREVLCKKLSINPILPPRPKTQHIGIVALTKATELIPAIADISEHFTDHIPHNMEYYSQDYGMILYHTEFEGDYPDINITAYDVHDIAYAYVNGKLAGKYDRSNPLTKEQLKYGIKANENFTFPISAFNGNIQIDIYVEALGRVNFSKHMYDRKGLSCVCIGEQFIYDFDIYTIPFDKFDMLNFSLSSEEVKCPAFFKGSFETQSKEDCFVKITNFTRGYVFINGKNLGRFWDVGPQKTLYLPGVWLNDKNEIVVLELESCHKPDVEIINKPILK